MVYWDCRVAKTEDPIEPKLEDVLEKQIYEKVMEIIFLKIRNLTLKLLPVIKRVFYRTMKIKDSKEVLWQL